MSLLPSYLEATPSILAKIGSSVCGTWWTRTRPQGQKPNRYVEEYLLAYSQYAKNTSL